MSFDSKPLSTAIRIASEAHEGTLDKGGSAYILHPIRVMMRLRTDDQHQMALAILHDAVEDGRITYSELRQKGFPEDFLADLSLLTHRSGDTYEEYIDKIVCGGRRVMEVKLQDLRDNSDITRLKGITDKDVARMVKYQRAFQKIQYHLNALVESEENGADVGA